MASRMLRRFLCLGILCALLLGAVPAAGAQGGITDEIRRAAALGIGELEHENTVVTYETYFQMLDALVALAASGRARSRRPGPARRSWTATTAWYPCFWPESPWVGTTSGWMSGGSS